MVIGAGDMGARHAAHWAKAGAKVTAICDPDMTRASKAALAVGATAYTDYKEVLSSEEVSAVSVCTPTFLHPSATLDCLNAGKHVLCEKPIALTLEDAEAMKDAASENEVELRVGFMRRFDPMFPKLKALTSSIGSPVYGTVRITAGIRPKRLMHDLMANGGPVIDMCCHIFDVWQLIFGEMPKLEYAAGSILAVNDKALAAIEHKAVDTALASFSFSQGHVMQLFVSWGLPEGTPPNEHHSYLSEGGIVNLCWNYDEPSVMYHDGIGVTSYSGKRDPWEAEIKQFYRELTDNAPQRVASAEDGIEALRLSLEVLKKIEGQ